MVSFEVYREKGSKPPGYSREFVEGRYSTLRPVSQPSLPQPAPCPLSPNICKSLKLSGLDLSDRAELCQTSDSFPGLKLNGLETLSRSTRGGQSSLPMTSSSNPFTSSGHWSAQYQQLGTAFHPTKGILFECTG